MSTVEKRMKHGVHLGRPTSIRSPKMNPYLLGSREGRDVRSMDLTVRQRRRSMGMLADVRKDPKGFVLVVATKPDVNHMAKTVLKEARKTGKVGRVTTRWIGGVRTNYDKFRDRMRSYRMKPEHLKRKSEKARYENHLACRAGRAKRGERPQARVRLNPDDHYVALKEANLCGIPTRGFVDSDSRRVDKLTYPIPGNTEQLECNRLYLAMIADRLKSSK